MSPSSFGEILRELRGERSLRGTARAAGLESGHLSEVENGKKRLSLERAEALSDALESERVLDGYWQNELERLGYEPDLAELIVQIGRLEHETRQQMIQRLHGLLEEIGDARG